MIVVKVTYTVKATFAEENKQNIAVFIRDFKNKTGDDFRYNIFIKKDGKTFIHLSQYSNEQIQQELLNTPSFKWFQEQRDLSGLEGEPQIEVLEAVAASKQLF